MENCTEIRYLAIWGNMIEKGFELKNFDAMKFTTEHDLH